MKTLILINTIVLVMALLVATLFFVLWIKAELKLADSNKSAFFKKKTKNKKLKGDK